MPPGGSLVEATQRVDRAVQDACSSMPSATHSPGTVGNAPLATSCLASRAEEIPFHKRVKIAFFVLHTSLGGGRRAPGCNAKAQEAFGVPAQQLRGWLYRPTFWQRALPTLTALRCRDVLPEVITPELRQLYSSRCTPDEKVQVRV
eukprot:GHVU01148290.1.p1 GENE.GHVU01148290.1~~GHVU01148290.1.p1  ORF type:complete len:146 (+),score=9.09 GHVU01148290.1:211-648(+)